MPAGVGWGSETFFHNSTDTAQTVQFLGVTNGSAQANPKPLSIAPHQTVKINGAEPFLGWNPTPGTILWVNRLDVPPGVVVANRVSSTVYDQSLDSLGRCRALVSVHAGLPLPVFGNLSPPGVTQYFLGTDTGVDLTGSQLDARLNVGVYNGGSSSATATVKTYCGQLGSGPASPNALVATDEMQVPADSVVQKTVLASTLNAGCSAAGGAEAFWYATVSVDQPSFAYAIGLANGALPKFPGTVALTYTGN